MNKTTLHVKATDGEDLYNLEIPPIIEKCVPMTGKIVDAELELIYYEIKIDNIKWLSIIFDDGSIFRHIDSE